MTILRRLRLLTNVPLYSPTWPLINQLHRWRRNRRCLPSSRGDSHTLHGAFPWLHPIFRDHNNLMHHRTGRPRPLPMTILRLIKIGQQVRNTHLNIRKPPRRSRNVQSIITRSVKFLIAGIHSRVPPLRGVGIHGQPCRRDHIHVIGTPPCRLP